MLDALAPAAGLAPGPAAAAQLLLVELLAHRASRTYPEAAAPLSDVREGAALLAYRYASAAQGPQSGLREAHIFHRRAPLHVLPAESCCPGRCPPTTCLFCTCCF